LRSAWSGIQVDVFTDQEAFQIYSCGGQNGSMALKETQGLFNVSERPRTIPQYGCIVMEVEDWIDGIVSISSHLFRGHHFFVERGDC
jgi:aldose 1-epimerase